MENEFKHLTVCVRLCSWLSLLTHLCSSLVTVLMSFRATLAMLPDTRMWLSRNQNFPRVLMYRTALDWARTKYARYSALFLGALRSPDETTSRLAMALMWMIFGAATSLFF
jgi:hypothetical protein